VAPEYVEENKRNIQKVMDALMANPIEGMQYASFTDQENPNTFVHINMARDSETMSKLNEVPEFNQFRMALKASGPLSPPKQTTLDFVGSGFDIQ
jgi:quinol monooxygenase YgiN